MIHILADEADVHTLYVEWAAEKHGITTHIVDFMREKAKFSIDCSVSPRGVRLLDNIVTPDSSVWVRRPHNRLRGVSELHADDQRFAYFSQKSFVEALLDGINESGAFLVNTLHSANAVRSSNSQLNLAISAGLCTPSFLLTNDSEDAISFARSTPSVLKSLHAFMWHADDQTFSTHTTLVTPDQVREAKDSILSCPIFLQEFLESDDELRVTFIGKNIFSASLNWSNEKGSRVDWKRFGGSSHISRVDLPEEVIVALRRFIELSGLRFGAIDLIRRGDEYFFIEVNQAGQWLWVEDACPELPLLDCFVQFLEARDPDFNYSWRPTLSSRDYSVDHISDDVMKSRMEYEVLKYGKRTQNAHPYHQWEAPQ